MRVLAVTDRDAGEIIGCLAENSTTRVEPRGRQVQVPVENLEAAVVRWCGGAALHLVCRGSAPSPAPAGQRPRLRGRLWRGLHSVGVVDSIEAINGIGHASNTAIHQVLDGAGFSWAIPRTFRRTVATLLHEAGVPIVHIVR